MKIGQVLLSRQDDIIHRWMDSVERDRLIESDRSLSRTETLDSLPDILRAIAQIVDKPNLDNASSDEIDKLIEEGLAHGTLRAKQGYDTEEIVREYALLRAIMLQVLSEAVDSTEPAEIFVIAHSVNSAVDKVVAFSMKRYADERLRELNVLYDELINSNQELDRIVRNEQSNLAHLAHELKTPLSSIIGYSELFLKRQVKEGAIHSEYIQQTLTSGRRLLRTIDNALEMSSYRAGKVALASQAVEASEIVDEVVAALRVMAQQKGLSLSVGGDRQNTQLVTDKARLRQVITNLLSNAIRYTESGSIQVRTRLVGGDRIEIEVTDTGYGISSAEQGLIFEPYYQGEAGQQLQSSTGLGLAITNQIVKLLQGSIQLKSEPKVGSTFTISLPLQLGKSSASDPSILPESNLETEIADTQLTENRAPQPIPVDSRATSH